MINLLSLVYAEYIYINQRQILAHPQTLVHT